MAWPLLRVGMLEIPSSDGRCEDHVRRATGNATSWRWLAAPSVPAPGQDASLLPGSIHAHSPDESHLRQRHLGHACRVPSSGKLDRDGPFYISTPPPPAATLPAPFPGRASPNGIRCDATSGEVGRAQHQRRGSGDDEAGGPAGRAPTEGGVAAANTETSALPHLY